MFLLLTGACSGEPAATPSAPAVSPDVTVTTPVPPSPGTPAVSAPPAGNPDNATPSPVPTAPNETPVRQSQFVVSDLHIAPNGVTLGELTTVTAKVTNTGNTTATYTCVLKVKAAWAEAPVQILPQAAQDVTLGAGESTTVTFRTGVMGNGAVDVTIEDQTDRFIVDSQI